MASRLQGRLLTAFWALRRITSGRRQRPVAPQNILILHHLLLGDSLMAVSLCAQLRSNYPEATIWLALPKAIAPLFSGRPWQVHVLGWDPRDPTSVLKLLHTLPQPDLCLLPAENRYSLLARALGCRWIIAFAGDLPAYKNWLVDELRPYSSEPTAWSDTLTELIGLAAPPAYSVRDWPAPLAVIPRLPAGPFVVLHVGASSSLKHWPAERWHNLALHLERRGYTPLWSSGAQEQHLVDACDPQHRWPSLAGRLDLTQLWHVLAQARLLVVPDTGIAHLGRVVGTPTLCLFGPGSSLLCGAGKFWNNMPYQAIDIPISCRNQNTNFQRVVPWIQRCERFAGDAPNQCASAACMLGLDQQRIIELVDRMLQDAQIT